MCDGILLVNKSNGKQVKPKKQGSTWDLYFPATFPGRLPLIYLPSLSTYVQGSEWSIGFEAEQVLSLLA